MIIISLGKHFPSSCGMKSRLPSAGALLCGLLLTIAPVQSLAQQRIRQAAGYERYQTARKAFPQIRRELDEGAIHVTWIEGGKAFEFQRQGKRFRYDIASRRAVALGGPMTRETAGTRPALQERRGHGGGPGRGRQFTSVLSPDHKLKAFYRDHNLYLSDASGGHAIAITTDGSPKTRVKYGTASWVYGEELFQHEAMWWSPDGSRLAFYRFDESRVPDFYLGLHQTRPHDTLDVEAYPMPGDPNPVVDLLVYDLRSKRTTRVNVRDGKPFDDTVIGHYVYHVSWSADGRELLFFRTNRRQNTMEFVAADPRSGHCRVIVREQWPASWVENLPEMRFLQDGRRFVWCSQRAGFNNLYLYNLDGRLLATLTSHPFEVAHIERVCEGAGIIYYTAHDGDNPMKLQLHRVNLDGTGERRLTDSAFMHTVDVAPDGAHFIDISQTHDSPPITSLIDSDGNIVAKLGSARTGKLEELGIPRTELLRFKAADGQTILFGLLHRPSHFDPGRRYPLLVSVYAGPQTSGARETFVVPDPLMELGFLVASFDSRSADGRGKRLLDSIYMKLGRTEIDDQAAGVRSLLARPYIDKDRVGIFGTSYGGYASIMCLLRYPGIYYAACASSPPTDWRNYDTIYTERYMWLPDQNRAGYDAGNPATYAGALRGRLMLYFGTADNNVHPDNALQLIAALERAGKSFDVQVGPDLGHSGLNRERMMEFFLDNLADGHSRN